MNEAHTVSRRLSYEEAVVFLRNHPLHAERIHDSYLDKDVEAAARRFEASNEFAELRSWVNQCGLQPGDQVLDLGAGNGIGSYAWAVTGFRVTAVDPDPSAEVGCGAIQLLARAGSFLFRLSAALVRHFHFRVTSLIWFMSGRYCTMQLT